LYKFYYPFGIFQENEKKILQILSQETSREILMFIFERRNPTQTDIAYNIKISPASVNWHIGRLIDFNIIDEVREGKYKRYHLRSDPKYTAALLMNYYPSIWDNSSNRLVEIFVSLSPQEK
jgi:predicted transcriptional regulator